MDVVAGRWGGARIFFRLFMLVDIIVENVNETLSDPSFCCACTGNSVGTYSGTPILSIKSANLSAARRYT